MLRVCSAVGSTTTRSQGLTGVDDDRDMARQALAKTGYFSRRLERGAKVGEGMIYSPLTKAPTAVVDAVLPTPLMRRLLPVRATRTWLGPQAPHAPPLRQPTGTDKQHKHAGAGFQNRDPDTGTGCVAPSCVARPAA